MAPALSTKPTSASPKSARLAKGSRAGSAFRAKPLLAEWSSAKAPNRASVLARVQAR